MKYIRINKKIRIKIKLKLIIIIKNTIIKIIKNNRSNMNYDLFTTYK